MLHVAVVAGHAQPVPLAVGDHRVRFHGVEAVQLAQVGGELHRLPVDRGEVGRIVQAVLADLKGDVGVVGAGSGGSVPRVPATAVPRQGLDRGDFAVRQPADKGVDADTQAGTVPVVAVGIDPQLTHQRGIVQILFCRLHIAAQHGVVRSCGMDHHPLGNDGFVCLIAVIFR